MSEKQDGCWNCDFSFSVKQECGETIRECRRHAPHPLPDTICWIWPLIDDNDWCGEHRLVKT